MYECVSGGLAPGEECEIERVPFRGANCSDAAGNQTTFMDIMNLFDRGVCPGNLVKPCELAGTMMWDDATLSPYFSFTSGGGVYQVRGRIFHLLFQSSIPMMRVLTSLLGQVWFDDDKSSGIKYGLASRMGLGGVGPYRFDQLDPLGALTGNSRAPAEATRMWASLSSFDGPVDNLGGAVMNY